MKKLLPAILLIALPVMAVDILQPPALKVREKITDGNLITASGGYAADAGVSGEVVIESAAIVVALGENATNVIARVEKVESHAIPTNTWTTVYTKALGSEAVANKNQADGYAGLNSEGKISASLVENIIVEFAGAEAVDVP